MRNLHTHLHVSRLRPPATHAALNAAATAVELVTDCCAFARSDIAIKQRLQMVHGVGPQLPSVSQVSCPLLASHTQRLVGANEVHIMSVLLQSAVTLQVPGARGVLGATTRPPGMILPVLVPSAVQRLKFPRGTQGAAGELPGTVVRFPRLQVGSKPVDVTQTQGQDRAGWWMRRAETWWVHASGTRSVAVQGGMCYISFSGGFLRITACQVHTAD